MAPFVDDLPAFDEQQSRVAAYDGLERGGVGRAERIFGSGSLAPSACALVVAGSEAVEGDVVLYGILVNLLYAAEVGLVGLFEVGCDEQEGVACIVEYLVGDVVAVGPQLD